jgi:hypothetical protein
MRLARWRSTVGSLVIEHHAAAGRLIHVDPVDATAKEHRLVVHQEESLLAGQFFLGVLNPP